jgi:hypothetical protein
VIFIIDNNSLRVLGSYYPEHFPGVWERLDAVVVDGTLRSVKAVAREIEDSNASEFVRDWVRKHRAAFLAPTSGESQFLAEIFAVPHFHSLIGAKQAAAGKEVADPYLIAAARVFSGCVVTEEAYKPNAAKIPNVCEHFGIECCDLQGMMKKLDWYF